MRLRSRVEIEDAVYVHIIGRRKVADGFEVAEDCLVGHFLEWLCRHSEIDSFPGGSSGMGNYSGWFPAEHRAAIEEFFAEQGFKPS